MASVSLPELVEAIATAVIEAQDRVDVHQLALLQRYFDKDDRPRSTSMVVPSLSLSTAPGDGTEDVRITIPWLALIRPNLLSIKEAKVDLEVELSDFKATASAEALPAESGDGLPGLQPGGEMICEVGAQKAKNGGALAKITLTVTGQEPSEGLARVIHELVKRIGVTSVVRIADNQQG